MKNIGIKGTSADAVFLTFIKLVTTVLGLAITRLLSQHLEVHNYGTYSQIMLLVSTVSSITMFGMMDGVNYFGAGEQDAAKRESYLATIFALQCTLSTVAGCIIMVLQKPICLYFDNADVSKYLIFAAVLPFLQNLLGMSQVLFVSIGKARLLAYRNLVVSLFRLIAVLIVTWVVKSAAVVLIASLILDIGQITFFWSILHKNHCRIKFSMIQPRLLGNIFHYCAPMAIYLIINTLNRDMDKYLISMMTDTETLALYANASKQLPFDIIMASFCTVLVPYITRYISEQNREKAAELYKLFLEITYISTGILCCAALSSAPQLMKLLYSNKYTDGLAIFCVYILVDLFRFTNITLVLSAGGKTKWLMFMGFGALGLNAVLNSILYSVMGIIGPAIATLVVTVIMGILMLNLSAGVLKMRLSAFFDFPYLLKLTVESIVLVFALSILRQYLEKMDVHYFLILIIVAGIYGVSMLFINGRRLLADMKKVNHIAKHTDEI